jgi:hypothetical protein
MVPLAALMLAVGLWLGRRQEAIARDQALASPDARTAAEPLATPA